MPEFGDIYVCRFPSTSGTFSKPRPVLILSDLEIDVVICRITSASYSGSLDVELRSWSVAGLEKPSVARLNRLVTEKSLLTKFLGRLAASDAAAIKAAWNQHMTL
jgi:mRNA-degrading endonuclease toxin of MazEF toxin-antitoxin module